MGGMVLQRQIGTVYLEKLDLVRPEKTYKAALCCFFYPPKADYRELIPYLHLQERNYYNKLRFEKRIRTYLMGRFVAKHAVASLTGEENLTNISIQSGIFTQPVVTPNQGNIQVSITHCDPLGAALAFPEAHPMGIDLEKISFNKKEVLESQITKTEKERISDWPFSYGTGLTLLWTAKEALSKTLKTGLMTPFEIFEISEAEVYEDYTICYYKNFAQYKVLSFTIGSYMCSIVHPFKTGVRFDLNSLKRRFALLESGNMVVGQ